MLNANQSSGKTSALKKKTGHIVADLILQFVGITFRLRNVKVYLVDSPEWDALVIGDEVLEAMHTFCIES